MGRLVSAGKLKWGESFLEYVGQRGCSCGSAWGGNTRCGTPHDPAPVFVSVETSNSCKLLVRHEVRNVTHWSGTACQHNPSLQSRQHAAAAKKHKQYNLATDFTLDTHLLCQIYTKIVKFVPHSLIRRPPMHNTPKLSCITTQLQQYPPFTQLTAWQLIIA